MSIVVVSQTLGSLGDTVGRELARTLSYEFVDRDMILLKAAEACGEAPRELEHFTDERPGLLERFSEATRRFVTYIEAAIWEFAARDRVVLMGRGAPFVLRRIRHALLVRITAPEALRARRVERERGLARGAADLVRANDQELAARIEFVYHVDWDDSVHYDVVLNTQQFDVPAAVRVLQAALQTERFQPTHGSLAEVTDRSLTARAEVALLTHPKTRDLPLFVACAGGRLTVSGTVVRAEHRRIAEEVCRAIPGVVFIANEIEVAGLIPPATV